MADNTRSQEMKKFEETIKNMVKGMLQENNKKQEQAIADLGKKQDLMLTELKSMFTTMQMGT